MIEVTGLRVPLAGLDGTPESELAAIGRELVRQTCLRPADVGLVEPRRRAVDARRRGEVHLVFTVRVEVVGGPARERALLGRGGRGGRGGRPGLRAVEERPARWLPDARWHLPDERVVVVGAGSAGLFCALALARAGLSPLLVERGDDTARRTASIRRFNGGGALDAESNVQFGLGGAGSFSDGKLGTLTRDAAHRLVKETLVTVGAPPSILWDAQPHLGSDVLPGLVDGIVGQIESLGGELRCRCRLVGIEVAGGRVVAVTLRSRSAGGRSRDERLAVSRLVCACGHSARDVFDLLGRAGVALDRKPFAMGLRIEHAQAAIDRAQFGRYAGHPALGPASYKLSCRAGGHGVFTFCMCPGGSVVAAASEPGGVVTNGMSLAARDGANANAGLLVDVGVPDLTGEGVLAGVALQRLCERSAYRAGGGGFAAPAQLVGDFLQGVASTGPGDVAPSYPRGVVWGDVGACLPGFVAGALREALPTLGSRLSGFDAADAVLTGVETRSSCPVRVPRGRDCQSLTVRDLFPCGEGAGYAGGIMSAATDGIRVARAVLMSL